MKRDIKGKMIGTAGIIACIALSPFGRINASAAEMIDCDGVLVPDTVDITELQSALDTLSDSQMAHINIEFKIVESRYTDKFDTLPRHMYTLWSERLFSENSLFRGSNTTRLTPGLLEIMPDYEAIYASKETVMDLSKACYVGRMYWYFPLVSSTAPSGKSQPRQKNKNTFVDALGRRPAYQGIPWRPGMAPTYSLPAKGAK